MWELLAAGAGALIDGEARAAFERALDNVRAGRAASPADRERLASVRARLGLDRLAQPIVSGAAAPPELLVQLHALGVPVVNLYALTEVPPIAVSSPDPADIGPRGVPSPASSCGSPTMARCSSGTRPPAPATTAGPPRPRSCSARDGWARTGDLGTLDAEGRLRLIGRRDEQIVTSLGTNIDPVAIEQALKAELPLGAQACVIGDGGRTSSR